jgi:hypothetical protein
MLWVKTSKQYQTVSSLSMIITMKSSFLLPPMRGSFRQLILAFKPHHVCPPPQNNQKKKETNAKEAPLNHLSQKNYHRITSRIG